MNTKLGTFALIAAMSCGAAFAQNPFAGQTPVKAELKKSFGSKDKVGDEITATTDQDVMLGTTKLPKGSTLIGHIVAVSKHSKDAPDGSVTIIFDHARPKKSDPMPIWASVYKILPAEDSGQRADVAGIRGNGSGVSTPSGAPSGAVGMDSASVAASSTRPGFDTNNNKPTTALVSPAGAPVQVASYVPGVAISAVASQEKSAIFTAKNGDVDLQAGMNIVVGVAPATK
jgi:hypothetical protein